MRMGMFSRRHGTLRRNEDRAGSGLAAGPSSRPYKAAGARNSYPSTLHYAVLDCFSVFPAGKSLFDPGVQMAGAVICEAGSKAARRFAAI